MSFLTGQRVTDRDVEVAIQRAVRLIVKRLSNGEIDPPDANRQLVDLIVKVVNTMTRRSGREGAAHEPQQPERERPESGDEVV